MLILTTAGAEKLNNETLAIVLESKETLMDDDDDDAAWPELILQRALLSENHVEA